MSAAMSFWITVSRLGESEIVLPIALLLSLVMAVSVARPICTLRDWIAPLALVVLLTTASKLAFLGWCLGLASIDFTGFSGHATLSAAIYPVAGWMLLCRLGPKAARVGAALGLALALLIAISRVQIHVHSVSEVVMGFMLGSAVSAWALKMLGPVLQPLPWWLPMGLSMWLVMMPVHAPPSNTHGMVIRMALALSNRSYPYVRSDLRRLQSPAAWSLR